MELSTNEPLLLPTQEHHHHQQQHSQLRNDLNNNLVKQTWVESKKLWHIAAPSIFSRLAMFSLTVITQSFAGHLSDHDLAAISIATTVIISISFGFLPADLAELRGTVALWLIPMHLSFAFQFTLMRFLQCQLKTGIIAFVSGGTLLLHILLCWVFSYKLRVGIVGCALILDFSWWASIFGLVGYIVFGGCPQTWNGFSEQAFVGLWDFTKLSLASGVMLSLENIYFRMLIIVSGVMKNAEVAVDALSIRWVQCPSQILYSRALAYNGINLNLVTLPMLFIYCELVDSVRTSVLDQFGNNLPVIKGVILHTIRPLLTPLSITIYGWESMIPLGLFAATGVRVANELGAKNSDGAKFSAQVAVLNSVALGFLFWTIVMVFPDKLAMIFTSSHSVITMVNELAYLLAITIAFNSIQAVLSGVAVGTGWQGLVALTNILCYYFIGAPLGFIFGWLLDFGFQGIWAGMIGGTIFQTIILIIITTRIPWDKEIRSQNLVKDHVKGVP